MGGSRPALVATGVAEVLDTCWRCLAASHPEATNATSTKAQLRREEDMIADCCKRTKSGG